MNYLDFHADTLTEIREGNLLRNTSDVDLERVRARYKKYVQVFALWKDRMLIQNVEEEFMELYQTAMHLLEEAQNLVVLCQNAQEMKQTLEMGKAAAFLSIEDVSIMGNYVEQIRDLGIRFALLTWNYENEYGCGAASGQQKGLKPAGKELVRKLCAQDVILDMSHLSDAGVEDVLSLSNRPIIASHSNAREICGHPRNLQREQIREIIARKGVIGMNLYPSFVGREEAVGVADLLRHMDYILELGGEDTLVMGCDFDGCSGTFPDGITGVESVEYMAQEFRCGGLDEVILEKIFYENGYQFLMRNL